MGDNDNIERLLGQLSADSTNLVKAVDRLDKKLSKHIDDTKDDMINAMAKSRKYTDLRVAEVELRNTERVLNEATHLDGRIDDFTDTFASKYIEKHVAALWYLLGVAFIASVGYIFTMALSKSDSTKQLTEQVDDTKD